MGMCASVDVFQAKLDELIGYIEGVKTYIDDILVLRKDSLYKHIEQLRVIFVRLCASGLKLNAPRYSFWLNGILYLVYVIIWEGKKPFPNKLQSIIDIGKTTTTTESQYLIGMVWYYRYMFPRRSYILAPLKEADSGPKFIQILCNDALEYYLKKLKRMVSSETLLSCLDWTIPFTFHTDASDKKVGAVISHNNKPIKFSKPQHNYTTTEKDLLAIVECIKQFRVILFGYEINLLSDHKNIVYATTLSESQKVIL